MPTQKENMEQFNYDADCFGVVSDLSENIKKGFFVKTLDSFMPNNDDIKSIRDYLSKAYPNLFQKKPQNYCPDANPSNKYLNINFETPYHNQTLSTDTNIIIDINGGLYLSSYKLYLD
ncbi:hypothetical protein IJM86_05305 [bacterium]|nr:hypothetical protein [bacterium]